MKRRSTSTGSALIPPCCSSVKSSLSRFFFCCVLSQILEMVDFRVTDGLVDLRLFAVISSLAQKIATME